MSENETSPELAALAEAARRIDETLVLAMSSEPAEALRETVFGLDDAALRRVVALTLARVDVTQPVELSVLVTGDAGLRALNREYRGRDESTDVLSCPLLDAPRGDASEEQLWQPAEELEALAPEAATLEAPVSDDAGDAGVAVNGYSSDGEDEVAAEESDFAFLTPEDAALHLGDIALSRDAVERQAQQAGHSAARELAYLLAHGVLHLVGYDDQTDAGYRAMVGHQEVVLAAAGIGK
ncbi:MAG TPA: rRNA maturation RNase YbeY [Ktedonobacterales bacterium]